MRIDKDKRAIVARPVAQRRVAYIISIGSMIAYVILTASASPYTYTTPNT